MLMRRYFLAGLFVLLLLSSVSPALAQAANEIEDINFQDILDALAPRDGDLLLVDILLYAIFAVGMVTSFLIPDKQMAPSLLIFTVLAMTVIAKLLIGYHSSAILEPCEIFVLPINVSIFVLPLIAAGMLRNVKGKAPKARMPSIITGLAGGGYFFLFWATQQRECESTQALPGIIDIIDFFSVNLPL